MTKHRLYLFSWTGEIVGPRRLAFALSMTSSVRSPKSMHELYQHFAQAAGDFAELGRHGRSSIFANNRHPAVAGFAGGDVDWDLAQQRHAQAFRLTLAAAATENVVAFVVGGTNEIAHVLDEPEHGHVHFFEHGGGFARVDERDFLRR